MLVQVELAVQVGWMDDGWWCMVEVVCVLGGCKNLVPPQYGQNHVAAQWCGVHSVGSVGVVYAMFSVLKD